jgi:hypothetical protein
LLLKLYNCRHIKIWSMNFVLISITNNWFEISKTELQWILDYPGANYPCMIYI